MMIVPTISRCEKKTSVVAENGEGSQVRAGVVDGVSRLFGYRRIGAYPLVVTVGLDLEAALAAARTGALMIISMAGLATVLLAALAFYLIRQNRLRTAYELELAEERRKLRSTNVELRESKGARRGSKPGQVDIPCEYEP